VYAGAVRPGIAQTADLKEASGPFNLEENAMDIHDKTRMRLDVKNSDVSGSVFDDVNMSGWTAHNVNMSGFRIENANLAGLHNQRQSGRHNDLELPFRGSLLEQLFETNDQQLYRCVRFRRRYVKP
jgi:uncharacterized protein YjbI with pentapeptide repeats